MIYQQSKIYRVIDDTTGLCYIGSTTQGLALRLAGHKSEFKRWKSGKARFCTSYKIIENNNYDIVLLEDYPCERKEQLHARERFG